MTASFPVPVKGLQIWTAVDFFIRDGRSTAFHDKTQIWILPITLGLKYYCPPIGTTIPIRFYAGAGMRYFFVHTHTHSTEVVSTINRNGMGGALEVGMASLFRSHFLFDIFTAYSIKEFSATSLSKKNVQGTSLDVSSINVGLGLGYLF